MSSSYQLILESASLVTTIDENNGWVGPDLDDKLDELLEKFDDKVKACLYVARKMEEEEKDLRALEIKINKRRHAIKNQRERVESRVHDMRKAAEDLGQDFKVKNNEYTVYLRKSVSLRCQRRTLMRLMFGSLWSSHQKLIRRKQQTH